MASETIFSHIGEVIEPEILDQKGHSLEYKIFPIFAHKKMLNRYLSSEKEKHTQRRRFIKDL